MAKPKTPAQPGVKDFNEGVYHRPPTGPSFVSVGVIALIIILIGTYLAFFKSIPFTGPGFQVNAVFDNATTVRPSSPVRIAGVKVGEVTEIERVGENARVTFTVEEQGRPLHSDAEITIRPRLFLEGNFFLDLQPGSPSAPELEEDGTIPITRTATAVQLDEVLTALQKPDRENLSVLLDRYGSALIDEPTARQDRDQDPDVRGESAAKALNDAFRYGARAGRGTAQVNQALLGEQSGDLSRLIDANAKVFDQLGASESRLRALISNLSTTAGAFAAESGALEQTIAELAPTLEQAEPSLIALNQTFPPLRAFARELTPSVKELPATIDAARPWLRQALPLLGDDELGGLAADLRVATPKLAAGTGALRGLLPQLRLTSQCVTNVLVPAGDIVINDDFATGAPSFKDFFYGVASQAGEGGNFDGNGQYLRVQPSGGPVRVKSDVPNGGFNNEAVFGNNIKAPIGSQPVAPSSTPPIRTDVECQGNDVPDLNGPEAQVGPPSPAEVTP